jgi:hypothetical protein
VTWTSLRCTSDIHIESKEANKMIKTLFLVFALTSLNAKAEAVNDARYNFLEVGYSHIDAGKVGSEDRVWYGPHLKISKSVSDQVYLQGYVYSVSADETTSEYSQVSYEASIQSRFEISGKSDLHYGIGYMDYTLDARNKSSGSKASIHGRHLIYKLGVNHEFSDGWVADLEFQHFPEISDVGFDYNHTSIQVTKTISETISAGVSFGQIDPINVDGIDRNTTASAFVRYTWK